MGQLATETFTDVAKASLRFQGAFASVLFAVTEILLFFFPSYLSSIPEFLRSPNFLHKLYGARTDFDFETFYASQGLDAANEIFAFELSTNLAALVISAMLALATVRFVAKMGCKAVFKARKFSTVLSLGFVLRAMAGAVLIGSYPLTTYTIYNRFSVGSPAFILYGVTMYFWTLLPQAILLIVMREFCLRAGKSSDF